MATLLFCLALIARGVILGIRTLILTGWQPPQSGPVRVIKQEPHAPGRWTLWGTFESDQEARRALLLRCEPGTYIVGQTPVILEAKPRP